MSHCVPVATLRHAVCFKFTPEIVVGNVLVTQLCWDAVPDTWPGSSKAPVTECVVCAWNSARTVTAWTSAADVDDDTIRYDTIRSMIRAGKLAGNLSVASSTN